MKDRDKSYGWMVAFIITLGLLILSLGLVASANNQKTQVTNRLDQLTSSNYQAKQSCVSSAEDTFSTGGYGIGESSSDALNAAVNGCKAEYSTN